MTPLLASLLRISSVFLFLSAIPAHAVGVATVDLDGATFGKGLDVHLSSGSTVLPPAASYDYAISGTLHGTGLLAAILPPGTELSALLEKVQAGSSSVLEGTQLNPGGTLPFSIINRTFSGSFPLGVGGLNATVSVQMVGRVTTTGQIRFHVVNVDFSVPGFPDLGTVVFEPGAKVVVSVKPVVEFRVARELVSENAGTLMVRVRRKVNTESSVTVHYASSPATATANDYDAVSGDLTFASGEVVKLVPITIKNRSGAQGSRIFRLNLSAPSGGILGLISREVVTITDAP